MNGRRRQGRRCSAIGAAVLLSAFEPGASAQDGANASSESVTEYAFDDELVAGVDRAPTGEVLHVRKQKRGESLVRARSSFLDRMLKSVEDLP